jgi:signal peptidase I
MITFLTLAIFGGAVVVQLGLAAALLWWGARWARIPSVTYFRAVATVMAILAANIAILCIDYWLGNSFTASPVAEVIGAVVELILMLGLTWLIVAWVFKTTFWRAAWAWVPTLLSTAAMYGVATLVIRPYLLRAFVISSNAMAPTVLGVHWEAPCPRCGGPAVASPIRHSIEPDNPVDMMCSREWRPCEVVNPPRDEHSADRVLVNKLLRPQRWDIVVFRHPSDPTQNYCKRLVGMPGETVVIRDGAVWADGKRLSPPESCAKIKYVNAPDGPLSMRPWATQSRPAKLGADEYFVLGDYSAASLDSRLWTTGAPGHPPYAVPASCMIGVVTHIYWPFSRWRVLR